MLGSMLAPLAPWSLFMFRSFVLSWSLKCLASRCHARASLSSLLRRAVSRPRYSSLPLPDTTGQCGRATSPLLPFALPRRLKCSALRTTTTRKSARGSSIFPSSRHTSYSYYSTFRMRDQSEINPRRVRVGRLRARSQTCGGHHSSRDLSHVGRIPRHSRSRGAPFRKNELTRS